MPGFVTVVGKLDLTASSARIGAAAAPRYLKLSLLAKSMGFAETLSTPLDIKSIAEALSFAAAICSGVTDLAAICA